MLCLLFLIFVVDVTIVIIFLLTIIWEIEGVEQYVWIVNSFVFAFIAFQSLYDQIFNIFDRRNFMLFAISLFALGSGLAESSKNPKMLINDRVIQGLRTGELYVLFDIVICDLIFPRHRGPYLSAVLLTIAIEIVIGSVIEGALAQIQWRWIFWLNLFISNIGLVAILLLLNVKYKRSPIWRHVLTRIDFLENAIFVFFVIFIFLNFIMSEIRFSWKSWHIIVSLIIEILKWVLFHIY